MQRSILRAVTLFLLTVISTRSSIGQTIVRGDHSRGDHFLNINGYRANGDSSQIMTVVYRDGGPLYVVQMKEGKVLTFSVDGRNIPTSDLGRYQSVIDDIKQEVKRAEEQARRDEEQAGRDREQAGRDREQADRDREQAERDRQQAQQDMHQAEREQQQAIRDREQAERDREQAERDRAQAERDRVQAEEDRKVMDSVITDLVADKIIPDRDSLHELRFNSDEMIVNGKRLPEALERKYISKYVKRHTGFSIERN